MARQETIENDHSRAHVSGLSSDERRLPDPNYEAYLRQAEELEATLPGQMVAYADGERIAAGKDAQELARNIPEAYRHRSLFIKTIAAAPIRFRRPFLPQSK